MTRPWGTQTKRATTDRYYKTMYEQTDGNAKAVVEVVEAVPRRAASPRHRSPWLEFYRSRV